MGKFKIRHMFIAGAVVGAFLLGAGAMYAMPGSYRTNVSSGAVNYAPEEATLVSQKAAGTEVKVTYESNASTEADYVYTVELTVDGDLVMSTTVSWTAGEIPGTKKKLTFAYEVDRGEIAQVDLYR